MGPAISICPPPAAGGLRFAGLVAIGEPRALSTGRLVEERGACDGAPDRLGRRDGVVGAAHRASCSRSARRACRSSGRPCSSSIAASGPCEAQKPTNIVPCAVTVP